MAISSYAELQSAVINWLHRDGLTTYVPDFITIGEKRIFREVRCRVMETALTGTISSGAVAVPADYLALKYAYINSSPISKLTRASASQLLSKYPLRSADGKPVQIARDGTNFIFGPYPDSNYSILGIYYAKPTIVSSSANALFVANPDLYLFASLCEAAPFIKNDERIPVWEAKYASIKKQLADEADQEEASGGGMAVVPG